MPKTRGFTVGVLLVIGHWSLVIGGVGAAMPAEAADFPAHARKELAGVVADATSQAGAPARTIARAGQAALAENPGYWFLTSPEFEAVVSKKSGLAYRITSRVPSRADLLPPTEDGLVVYMWNSQYKDWLEPGYLDWFGVFNRLVAGSPKVSTGEQEGRPYVRLSCTLDLGEPYLRDMAQLDLSYTLLDDLFNITARVRYLKTDHSAFEIGLGHRCDKSHWIRQLYPSWASNLITVWPVATDEASVARYREASWDSINTSEDMYKGRVFDDPKQIYGHVWWDLTYDVLHPDPDHPVQGVREPFGILEGADRYLLWGYLDLNSFTVLAPNRNGMIPAFAIQPKEIREGESYTFDYIYKVFPRPENTIIDVNRWYAQNLHSTNPLTQGIVRMPKNPPHKTIPPGNLSFYAPIPLAGSDPAWLANVRELTHQLHFTNLWHGLPMSWEELHPVEPYYLADGTLMDPAKLRADVKRLQDDGYRVYQYCRQLHPSYGYFWEEHSLKLRLSGERRRKEWIYRGEGGWPFVYPFGPVPGVKVGEGDTAVVSERLKQAVGITDSVSTAIHADFNNPELIAWYLEDVKAALDYYDFAGFAWDMGWDVHVGVEHGICRLQYEVWKWMQKAHPDKYNLMNNTAGTPCHLYMDAIDYEGGAATDRLSAESLKAYNTPQMNLTYAGSYKTDKYKNADNWKDLFIQDMMRTLSYGVTYGGRGIDLVDPEYAFQLRLEKVAQFSAIANSVTMVTDSHAIEVEPARQVTGTVWADADHLMAAIYNDRAEAADVRIILDTKILSTYGWRPGEVGPLPSGRSRAAARMALRAGARHLPGGLPPKAPRFTLVRSDGSPEPTEAFACDMTTPGFIVIEGRLGSKELLLVE